MIRSRFKGAINLAKNNILEKNPTLAFKENIALSWNRCCYFSRFKNYRLNDIEFLLEDMLRFEGETSPYVQSKKKPLGIFYLMAFFK